MIDRTHALPVSKASEARRHREIERLFSRHGR